MTIRARGKVWNNAQFTSPVSELHLVVRKVGAGVIHNAVARLHVDASISLPQVAMDQAWLYRLITATLAQIA